MTRDSYVRVFGEHEAVRIEEAATSHENGVHDNKGSDPFRWAIAICIGYECFSKPAYREYHGIAAPLADIERWIHEEANLGQHDGGVDYLAMFTGRYNRYVGQPDDLSAPVEGDATEEADGL